MNPGPADTSPQGTQQAGSAIRAISRLSNNHPSPSSLAMSIRCTSEVPSPISSTFASR